MSNETHSPETAPPPGWYPNPQGQQQWWDGAAWGQLAETVPTSTKKPKRAWYKKWWVWVIVGIVLIIGFANMGSSDAPEKPKAATVKEETAPKPAEVEKKEEPAAAPEPAPEPDVPTEYKSALKQAKSYSDMMHMSKAGLYDQLTSEYGGKFTPEAGQYAIDNVVADWNANALESAKSYQDMMDMSPAAIYDQLVSEYGGQFLPEEAQYAVDNL